jgi:hypothetical protein
LGVQTLAADPSVDMTELKRLEVARLRSMAEAGAIPRARLDQAQAELADAEDNAVLRRTLYGTVRIEDFTKEQTGLMLAAAQRLVDRQQERYDSTKKLVDEGVLARVVLDAFEEDLAFRRKALDLARFRAQLVEELSAQIQAEEDLEDAPSLSAGRAVERYQGKGILRQVDFAKVSAAFQRQFSKDLPVSARGDTALHRSLGFDHRGRVDIAVTPHSREGTWLRTYLQKLKIPYYAFSAAIRGKATGAHFHLGPPSLRFRAAD